MSDALYDARFTFVGQRIPSEERIAKWQDKMRENYGVETLVETTGDDTLRVTLKAVTHKWVELGKFVTMEIGGLPRD